MAKAKGDQFGARVRFNWGYHDGGAEYKQGIRRRYVGPGERSTATGPMQEVTHDTDPVYYWGHMWGREDAKRGKYRPDSEPAWLEFMKDNPQIVKRHGVIIGPGPGQYRYREVYEGKSRWYQMPPPALKSNPLLMVVPNRARAARNLGPTSHRRHYNDDMTRASLYARSGKRGAALYYGGRAAGHKYSAGDAGPEPYNPTAKELGHNPGKPFAWKWRGKMGGYAVRLGFMSEGLGERFFDKEFAVFEPTGPGVVTIGAELTYRGDYNWAALPQTLESLKAALKPGREVNLTPRWLGRSSQTMPSFSVRVTKVVPVKNALTVYYTQVGVGGNPRRNPKPFFGRLFGPFRTMALARKSAAEWTRAGYRVDIGRGPKKRPGVWLIVGAYRRQEGRNPGPAYHKREAARYGRLLAGDLKAGHRDAAEYWQGALSAEAASVAVGKVVPNPTYPYRGWKVKTRKLRGKPAHSYKVFDERGMIQRHNVARTKEAAAAAAEAFVDKCKSLKGVGMNSTNRTLVARAVIKFYQRQPYGIKRAMEKMSADQLVMFVRKHSGK